MAVRRLAPAEVQPSAFAFTAENQAWAERQIAKFPPGRQASAVIPLLWRAQEQAGGWVPEAAIVHIAEMLGMAKIRVLEVATFYTMFNLEPVGKHLVQVCGTTPCRLRGADALLKVCHDRIGPEKHVESTGTCSWMEVECLGACVNAPMVQIGSDYFEDLDAESFGRLLDDLFAGRSPKPGPAVDRQFSAPRGGAKTLTDPSIYDGSGVGAWRARFEELATHAGASATAKEPAQTSAAAAAAPTAASTATAPMAPLVDKHPAAAAAGVADALAAKGPASPMPAGQVPGAASPARSKPVEAVPPSADKPVVERIPDDFRPELFPAPRDGRPDDLEIIWGVGPKLAALLNKLGVWHFDQIAGWTDMNLRWVDQNLGAFKGRAVRDKWIAQAQVLARGGTAADAEKIAKG